MNLMFIQIVSKTKFVKNKKMFSPSGDAVHIYKQIQRYKKMLT